MRVADPLVRAESHPGLHGFCRPYEEFVGVRLRVFHRSVSKSGGGCVRAGKVNTPPGWTVLSDPVV